jgi:hypothetical protein
MSGPFSSHGHLNQAVGATKKSQVFIILKLFKKSIDFPSEQIRINYKSWDQKVGTY